MDRLREISLVVLAGFIFQFGYTSEARICPPKSDKGVIEGVGNIEGGSGSNVDINADTRKPADKPLTPQPEIQKTIQSADQDRQEETGDQSSAAARTSTGGDISKRFGEREQRRGDEVRDRGLRDLSRYPFGEGTSGTIESQDKIIGDVSKTTDKMTMKREEGKTQDPKDVKKSTSASTEKDKQVATLIISPKEIELNVGESKSFSATAASADGTTRNVTGEASWSGGTGNSFKATKGGQYTISATYRGMSGSATVIVKRTAVKLYVTPKQKTVNIGEQVSFTSTAEFEDGSKDTVKAQWNPSNPFVGTEAKTYTITARYENLSDSATVTVRQTASAKLAGADLFIGTWRLTFRPKSHSSPEGWEQIKGTPPWSKIIRIAKSGNSYSFTGLPGFITDNVSVSGNNMTIKGRTKTQVGNSVDIDLETIQLKCTADGKNLDGTEKIDFPILDAKTGSQYGQSQVNLIVGVKQ